MASPLEVSATPFGAVDGQSVHKLIVRNPANGMTLALSDYGATILSVLAPDRDGNCEECTLQYATLDEIREKSPYYGVVAGRVANRIKNGKFSVDGQEYSLYINNAPNSLHGGKVGFDKRIWSFRQVRYYPCCISCTAVSLLNTH